MAHFTVRPLCPADQAEVKERMRAEWGAETVVAHGIVFHPADLPGFLAEGRGRPAGLITYHVEGEACEIVTLNSWKQGRGVGSLLIETVRRVARAEGCARLWLVTTNDNTHALRFYQKRGFHLAAVRPNAMQAARLLKPEIPLLGENGIPLRDELELEMVP